MKIFRGNPDLDHIGQIYRAFYMKTQVCLIMLAATYVAQQDRKSIFVLP
jgi:hypothetical protein